MHEKDLQRFTAKIEKQTEVTSPHVDTPCWLWTAYRGAKGYGRFRLDGAIRLAHRVSFLHFVGDIGTSFQACHRCDTPACVNPAHLFAGTNRDNALDRKSKGRCGKRFRGAAHHNSKLTAQDVLQMRALAGGGVIQVELAQKFGVSQPHVARVLSRGAWDHV